MSEWGARVGCQNGCSEWVFRQGCLDKGSVLFVLFFTWSLDGREHARMGFRIGQSGVCVSVGVFCGGVLVPETGCQNGVPEWGARMGVQSGCSDRVVWIRVQCCSCCFF